MYVYGGVYADYDFVSVKPLGPLLRLLNDFGIILGTMGKKTGGESTFIFIYIYIYI